MVATDARWILFVGTVLTPSNVCMATLTAPSKITVPPITCSDPKTAPPLLPQDLSPLEPLPQERPEQPVLSQEPPAILFDLRASNDEPPESLYEEPAPLLDEPLAAEEVHLLFEGQLVADEPA
jgi:hypothetical protein